MSPIKGHPKGKTSPVKETKFFYRGDILDASSGEAQLGVKAKLYILRVPDKVWDFRHDYEFETKKRNV